MGKDQVELLNLLENEGDSDQEKKKIGKEVFSGDGKSTFQDEIEENETPEIYKKRWRSIRIHYLTLFFSTIQYAIAFSSLWPYLQKVDPTVSTTFLGWTVSGFSLCQLVSSLLFGRWCDHRPSIEPLLLSLLLMSTGSVLYGYAEGFHGEGRNIILIARLLLGLSSGNVAICRTVIARSTTMKERATAFGNLSIWQAIGFIFGPVMQIFTIPLGDKGIHLGKLNLTLDIYTAPGFLGLFMSIINVIVVLLWYKDFSVDSTGKKNIPEERIIKPDVIAVAVGNILFFIFLVVLTFNESILVPLLMDEFAWTTYQTVWYGSIIWTASTVISIFSFIAVKYLSNRLGDKILVAAGLSILLLGFIIYLPWGNAYPKLQTIQKIPGQNASRLTTGCPRKYTWCTTTPKMYFSQFLVAANVAGIGHSGGFLAINTMYSKILPPKQQGKYMAIVSAVGCLARVTGPLITTQAYTKWGPRWTFASVDVLLVLAITLLGCSYHRIIPYQEFVQKRFAINH